MFRQLKDLKKNLNTFQGKIEFVTYMSNIVLLSLHVLFLGFYIYERIYTMIAIDLIGMLVYIRYTIGGIKNEELFGHICYLCITTHNIMAILCLGWAPGYYLWLFALVCAFFLPSFGKFEGRAVNRPLYMGLFYAAVYFTLGFLIPSGVIKPFYSIHYLTTIVLFGVNSVVSFLTIISFTYFYTTRQKAKEDSLKHMADYDPLTNLRNRNAINRIIDERIKDKDHEFSIAILDIDLFKNVNDTYGHNAGDYVLKEIAKKITTLEGFGITCARWGGEEFLILGANDMSYKQFVDMMQDFRRNIRESKFTYNRSIIKVTVSIGVSEFNKKNNIKKAIEKADKHLYKAKSSGRNKVIY